MDYHLERAADLWMRGVIHARWWVIIVTTAVTLLSLHYAVNNLKINTDLADMLSKELPFKQTYETYKRAFPQYVDNIVIVIEGETPEQARSGARILADRLRQTQGVFRSVHESATSALFERQALLFMDIPRAPQRA